MRIESRGDIIDVALAAEMSVGTTSSCAVDGLDLTVVRKAVCTSPLGGPSAASRHFVRWAGPGCKALDIAKNQLWWKVQKCVKLPRKTNPSGMDFRHGPLRPCCGIHYRLGRNWPACTLNADRKPRRYHRRCIGSRDVCWHDKFVRSGWSSVNGRDMCLRGAPSEENVHTV